MRICASFMLLYACKITLFFNFVVHELRLPLSDFFIDFEGLPWLRIRSLGIVPFLIKYAMLFWGLPLVINDFYIYFQGLPWLRIRSLGTAPFLINYAYVCGDFPLELTISTSISKTSLVTHTLFGDCPLKDFLVYAYALWGFSHLINYSYAFGDFPLTINNFYI